MKNNKTISDFVLEFYCNLEKDENHRYRSWEHCYIIFQDAFKKYDDLTDEIKDILSLHLAFYLASWGMYRGSTFLLQKDYKVFYPVVDLLIREKNQFTEKKIKDLLKNGNDTDIKKYVENYFKFDEKLHEKLDEVRKPIDINATDTLKTKIILGTYGVIPAYDKYFKDGVIASQQTIKKDLKRKLIANYSKNSVTKLLKFAKENLPELQSIKKEIRDYQIKNNYKNQVDYPIMKILDMCFWQIGYNISKEG